MKIFIQSKFSLSWSKTDAIECIIFGNGPSAEETISNHLERLESISKICVNHFASSEIYQKLRPEIYFLLDPAFADPKSELGLMLIKNLSSKTTWPLKLYVPQAFCKSSSFMSVISKNSLIEVVYFNYIVLRGFDIFLSFIYRRGLGMPQCMNVLVGAIFMAIQSGFKRVYITGAEHSWHENLRVNDNNNDVILNDAHFYGKRRRVISEEFASELKSIESEMANQFLSLHKVFKGHEILARMAEKQNVEIVNISSHSVIDVYKRGEL